MSRELGDKLGPRISRLVAAHTLAARRSIAPVEARIRAAGTQHLIDRMGHEAADHYRPLLDLLPDDASVHPALAAFIGKAASGRHQWQAAGQFLFTNGGIASALSEAMSNAVAPIVYRINSAGPNLDVDVQSTARATASGIVPIGEARSTARDQGFGPDQFQVYVDLAASILDPSTIQELLRRGELSEADAQYWLGRGGWPQRVHAALLALREQLLAPADAALAVLRGNMTQAQGYAIANKNGVSNADFDVLVGNTGEPPALEEMLMLRRRGKITDALLDRAIKQSRVRDEWIPYVKELSVEPPSAADVLRALVQGQIQQPEAVRRFTEAGGDPTWFQAAYDSTAESPSPVQLAEMANRGFIPWDGQGPQAVTWIQGFREGRWKDKWAPAFRKLATYLPPPREVATLVREGGITQDQAMAIWEQHGLTPEMAHIYWNAAHFTKTAAVHTLAQSEITRLYHDQAISRPEAEKLLESIRWTPIDANYLLDITDLQRERQYLERAVSKVNSLYVAHKIGKQAASKALADLQVPASQVTHLMQLWDLEAADNVKSLSAAEIVDLFFYNITSADEAMTMLEQDGYTRLDAWYLLAIKTKGPPPGVPRPA